MRFELDIALNWKRRALVICAMELGLAASLVLGVVCPVFASDSASTGGETVAIEAPVSIEPIPLPLDGNSTATVWTEQRAANGAPKFDDAATSAAIRLLDRIEKRHGNLKSLTAEFDQTLVTEMFGEEIVSHGRMYLQLPDRLRCDYFEPDPATLLFVKDTMYMHYPTNAMVDKFTYPTEQEAREQFKTLLLGFGLSSEEILKSYRAATVSRPGEDWTTSETALQVIDFAPLDENLAKSFKEIRVGFDPETFLPRRVRIEEVGGEVRTLTIHRILLDDRIDATKFESRFPGNPEIVEH